MKVITDANQSELCGSIVSIGTFDGVHRGHRRVLEHLRTLGARRGLPTAVLTFEPHPRAVLRPDGAPPLLSSLADRLELLAATGAVDHCLVLRFDHERSRESADDFVRHTLVGRLGMRALVVGENFVCGHARRGNVAYLAGLGAALGFELHPMPLRSASDPAGVARCSSSETRRLIQSGDLHTAAALLARPHELTGIVAGRAGAPWRAVDAVVPAHMCVPPADDYTGAVRSKHSSSPWVPALLRVRAQPGTERHSVRLVAREALPAAVGDPISLRFFGKAHATSALGA